MKTLENVRYTGEHPRQVLDVYLPDGEARCVFLYIHGGGLDHGSKDGYAAWAPELTSHGIAFVASNYRLYPDAKYPEFIEDSAHAVAYARNLARELGTDNLYVCGSSAGGYMTMMLCFNTSYLKNVGVDPSEIKGYLHDAGQPTAHFAVLKERGVDPRRVIIDDTAPLYFFGLEEKYPPMRFIVSDNDMKNRYEQTMLVLSTLSHFGYTNYDHIVMRGKHCQYNRAGENGELAPMVGMIKDFVNHVENIKE